jgi:hypothetical protein
MGAVAAHHLLGRSGDGQMILLVGPDYLRMQQMAAQAGIETREVGRTENLNAEIIRAEVVTSGRSLVFMASVPEVEGRLDRSSFGPRLTDLAYEADRVVYAGADGAVMVHPLPAGDWMDVLGGVIRMHKALDIVADGTVTPLASGR